MITFDSSNLSALSEDFTAAAPVNTRQVQSGYVLFKSNVSLLTRSRSDQISSCWREHLYDLLEVVLIHTEDLSKGHWELHEESTCPQLLSSVMLRYAGNPVGRLVLVILCWSP